MIETTTLFKAPETGAPRAEIHDDVTVRVDTTPIAVRAFCHTLGTKEIEVAVRSAFLRFDAETKASLYNTLSAILKEQAQ